MNYTNLLKIKTGIKHLKYKWSIYLVANVEK